MTKAFVRDATGFVREVGWFDAFQYNIASLGGPAYALSVTTVCFLAGGWPIAWLAIGWIAGILLVLSYYLLNLAMPRTGGDYVFVSRVLHPSLGLVVVAVGGFLGPLVFIGSYAATGWISTSLSPFLFVIGTIYNYPSLVTLSQTLMIPTVTTVIGVATILIFTAICGFLGTKMIFKVTAIMMLIATAAGIGMALVFLSTTNSQFISIFDSTAKAYGTSYSDVINSASSAGWKMPELNLYNSLVASTICGAGWPYVAYSTTFGGEVKSARRSQLLGMLGCIVVFGVVLALLVLSEINTVGYDFLSAADYAIYFAPSAWKLPVLPYLPNFATLIVRNPIISLIFAIGWSFNYLAVAPWCIVQFSRYFFALSFDRVMPSFMSDVSDRFHTPLKAVSIAGVFGLIALFIVVTPVTAPYILYLVIGLTMAYIIAWMITSFTAAMLPYRRKDIYDLSPFKRNVAGIPVITIIGVASVIFQVMYLGFFIAYPTFFGLGTTISQAAVFLGIQVAVLGLFFVLYFVVRAYRKSQGLNLDMAFKEIPPE